MFTDLYFHSRPVGNGTKEVLGIYVGQGLKWIRIYPSIFLKKDHMLSIDGGRVYDVPKSETDLMVEKPQVATFDSRSGQLIVFGNPKEMLQLRKEEKFAKWEAFCGSIVRCYYLVFHRRIF